MTREAPASRPGGRRALLAVIAIGIGLVLAPVAFRMFERAPKGGDMLDEFRPYMTEQTIADFRDYLATVDRASAQTPAVLDALPDATPHAQVDRWLAAWDGIETEMVDMLDDMGGTLGNFAAVDALPPFPLFPWFFVLPGVILAGLGVAALRSSSVRLRAAIGVVGVGLIAAPAVFQMFSRAPEGKEMIDTFRPLMTREKVTRIQGYFLTLGNGEAELRRAILPAAAGTDPAPPVDDLAAFVEVWPSMANEMAPMIGAMADNLDNYAAVDALPPFSLFPWFFVAPGVLAAGLAWSGRPRRAESDEAGDAAVAPIAPEPHPEPSATTRATT